MHPCSVAALVVTLVAALAAPPAAHASDERHSPKVGSVPAVAGQATLGPQASAGTLLQPKADSVANGVAIGALIGSATGLALMGWAYAQCDDTCDAPEPAPMYLMAGGVGAAVGAVVGLIIDKAKKSTSQRVTVGAFVTQKRSQVRVTVGF
jgi:hypothetical protein